MKIRHIDPSQMMRHTNGMGRRYCVQGKYNLKILYRFRNTTSEKAKARLHANDGIIGYNSSHELRPENGNNPHNPKSYLNNGCNVVVLMDGLENVNTMSHVEDGNVIIELDFDAMLYLPLSDYMFQPLGADSKTKPQKATPEEIQEFVDDRLTAWAGWNMADYILNDLPKLPYLYPGLEYAFDIDEEPWKRAKADVFIKEAIPMEEPVATVIFDPETYKEYSSKKSLMR